MRTLGDVEPVSRDVHKAQYVWIDKDGETVSVHNSFGTALNFIDGWSKRYRTALANYARNAKELEVKPDSPYAKRGLETSRKVLEQCTRTGNPPVDIRRLQRVERTEAVTASEFDLASQELADELEKDRELWKP